MEIKKLMSYREIIVFCSTIGTERINTLCGQNAVLFNVEPVVHIVTTELLRVKSHTQNWKYGFFARNMNLGLPLSQSTVVQSLRK